MSTPSINRLRSLGTSLRACPGHRIKGRGPSPSLRQRSSFTLSLFSTTSLRSQRRSISFSTNSYTYLTLWALLCLPCTLFPLPPHAMKNHLWLLPLLHLIPFPPPLAKRGSSRSLAPPSYRLCNRPSLKAVSLSRSLKAIIDSASIHRTAMLSP